MIQAIVLVNNQIIIAQSLPETDSDTGEAYFNLMYPYLITFDNSYKLGFNLTPWLDEVTNSAENFIVYPDKIITVREPKPEILNYYKRLVLFDENKIIKEEKVDGIVRASSDQLPIQEIVSAGPINEDDIDEVFIEQEEEDL